ncbi:hypothetical protein KP509_18G068700 [Ceratopteris richardii]|uniref:Chlorophyllase n=1 Tax=Ceratopteris richardii TaxID=49495 RepID=A0A8T2SS59_CERRI|nr:hypothetical protein KP509_18G068700 [Ceratopteris richardii]
MDNHQYLFDDGPLRVRVLHIHGRRPTPPPPTYGKNKAAIAAERIAASIRLPPKNLMIAAPEDAGAYPVLFIYHGFLLLNQHYSQLLQHVASHGYIVIAPQIYVVAGADATQEIADAAAIINWLPEGLADILSEHVGPVLPRLDKLALAGHSRGAKTAFGLALGLSEVALNISAIAGLDPVDGMDVNRQTTPPILKFSEHCFGLHLPILIIGAGLGSLKRNALFPPCAPEGVSHRAFFSDCSDPAFYFVATEHGHMDFLDDQTHGFRGKLSYCTCRNGPSRGPMRRFSGGILVAFLQAALHCESKALQHFIDNPSHAPVKLEKPKWYIVSSTTEASSNCPDLSEVFVERS